MEKEELGSNIERDFEVIYNEFRLKLYKHIFGIIGEKTGSLSATEYFAAEVVYLLGSPTVTEFAEYLNISSPNAAYKVRSLIDKGYLVKTRTEDKRSYRLSVTEKFTRYYHKEDSYGAYITKLLEKRLTAEELAYVEKIFRRYIEQINMEKEKEGKDNA
ncbi:MAG TPA: winged helix DNA-binding protein [Candidatus Protoclostridium stercorigallinarum]|uniref:Winged helix DNA-binding protein n=1 Tax=Candidatus Protoclostridium stercorigallinarum TaxID=2838741 RepID=A0A9D1PZS1_9FIRM|nr:winged helix DNA-binding protein [Candidatus Protoclostridium stercorigallinarum]